MRAQSIAARTLMPLLAAALAFTSGCRASGGEAAEALRQPGSAEPVLERVPEQEPGRVDEPGREHKHEYEHERVAEKAAVDPGAAQPAKPVPSPTTAPRAGRVRTIHPQPGEAGCVEMYGSCSPPPDQVCTTQALYVDCGKRARVPGSTDQVSCLCP